MKAPLGAHNSESQPGQVSTDRVTDARPVVDTAKAHRIDRANVRESLPVRTAPYWQSLGHSCAIGYRKTQTGAGTWIARWTNEEYVHTTRSFGRVDRIDFRTACEKAHQWFAQCRSGAAHAGTVEAACRDHVENLKAEKGERPAGFVDGRFKNHLYQRPLATKKVDAVTTRDVEQWRNGLLGAMKKSSANRILHDLKAALNRTARRDCLDDKAWRYVKTFKGQDAADGARTVYLNPAQRRRLLAAADPDLADLLRGLLFTAARPLSNAELPVATVADFDPEQKNLALRNYKGDGSERKRVVPLSTAGVEFFSKMSQNKAPTDLLFMRGSDRWKRHAWDNAIDAAVKTANKKADEDGAPAERLPADTCAYTMRHCAITDRLKAGIHIGRVAKDAGTSVSMIEKYYAKYLDDADVRAKLAAVIVF